MSGAPKPTTVPIEQYEAEQDALMKALLGGFTRNPAYLRIAMEKAIERNIVKVTEEGDEANITVVEWDGR